MHLHLHLSQVAALILLLPSASLATIVQASTGGSCESPKGKYVSCGCNPLPDNTKSIKIDVQAAGVNAYGDSRCATTKYAKTFTSDQCYAPFWPWEYVKSVYICNGACADRGIKCTDTA